MTRTVRQFQQEIQRIYGDHVTLIFHWWSRSLSLRTDRGEYALGHSRETELLTVSEQQAICLYFGYDPRDLGLNLPET